MTRDEYAKFKAREEIAHKILDKINVVESSDIDIIPAIMDFVQTGNVDLFEKYKKFRLATTHEKEELLKKGEEIEVLLQEYKQRRSECLKELRLYAIEFDKWQRDFREKMRSEVEREGSDLLAMKKIIDKVKDSGKNVSNRTIYVKVGDELKIVRNISMTENFKVILETEHDSCFDVAYPRRLCALFREADGEILNFDK